VAAGFAGDVHLCGVVVEEAYCCAADRVVADAGDEEQAVGSGWSRVTG
jgi:hypothetical protein